MRLYCAKMADTSIWFWFGKMKKNLGSELGVGPFWARRKRALRKIELFAPSSVARTEPKSGELLLNCKAEKKPRFHRPALARVYLVGATASLPWNAKSPRSGIVVKFA